MVGRTDYPGTRVFSTLGMLNQQQTTTAYPPSTLLLQCKQVFNKEQTLTCTYLSSWVLFSTTTTSASEWLVMYLHACRYIARHIASHIDESHTSTQKT